MAANVRTDTQVLSSDGRAELQPEPWDWHVAARRGDTDPAMALAARAWRIAWRLAHPNAWRAELERCDHYDPAYVYDEAHEYDFDWTTDPDYPFDVRHNAYDPDGFVCPEHEWHLLLLARMFPALCDLFDDIEVVRVLNKPDLYNPEALGKALGLRTTGGLTKEMVRPDVLVLPVGARLQESRVLRIAQGDPVPELAVEIVSPTSRDQDFDDKLRLYAALGHPGVPGMQCGFPASGRRSGVGTGSTALPAATGCHVRADGCTGPDADGRRSLPDHRRAE